MGACTHWDFRKSAPKAVGWMTKGSFGPLKGYMNNSQRFSYVDST